MSRDASALPGSLRPVTLRSLAAVMAVYAFCGWLGIRYGTIDGSSLSLLWLPSGIGLAACVIYGRSIWPAIWLGAFVSNTPFLVDPAAAMPLLKAVAFGAGAASIDTLVQALLAHLLFQRAIGARCIQSTQSIVDFLVKVTALPSALNMLLLVALYGLGGYIRRDSAADYLSVWLAGTMADYHGYFVAGLFCIVWAQRADTERKPLRAGLNLALALVVLASLLAIGLLWDGAAIYLITTLGVLVAMYWGLRAATGFVLCISLALTAATASHIGPLVAATNFNSLVTLLLYVFGLGVPIYLLATNRYELTQSKLELEDKVIARTRALNEANQRLEALSQRDGLTGLANRRHFDEVLAREWRRAARQGETLALAMLDVDHFKHFNDRYGHPEGDQCLRAVAEVLAATVCRAGDQVARYGGEEFVLLMPSTSAEQALCNAERLAHEASSFGIVTASIGVAALVPDAAQAPATLVKLADEALYRAKAEGRNRAVLGQR